MNKTLVPWKYLLNKKSSFLTNKNKQQILIKKVRAKGKLIPTVQHIHGLQLIRFHHI